MTKDRLREIKTVVNVSFQADPRRAIAVLVFRLGRELGDTLIPLWLKFLADAVIAGSLKRSLFFAVLIVVSIVGSFLLSWLSFDNQLVLSEKIGFLMDERIAKLSLNIPGLEHHERPDFQDKMTLLREERQVLGDSMSTLVLVGQLTISFAASIVLLYSVGPVLALLPLFGFPLLALQRRSETRRQRVIESNAEDSRRVRYLFDLATNTVATKEIFVLNVGKELFARHKRLASKIDRAEIVADVKATGYIILGWGMFSLGYGGAIAYVTWLVMEGRATPGDVLMALGLAAQIHVFAQWGLDVASSLIRMLAAINRFHWLLDFAERSTGDASTEVSMPDKISESLRFESVSFRYPASKRDALTDINFTIPAGSIAAIVGENGAGKSTLVKLLCRFYEPTEGHILLDGVDIRNFNLQEWRKKGAAAFQDFARLEFTVQETVGVGDLSRINDLAVVTGALKRAGADEDIKRMPQGMQTMLGKDWPDGIQLSGGQWQKLALSRAMMRQLPLMLMLDEPTASLDAETEHALFERYVHAARASARVNGTITIIVSHRLSTARMADLVIVVGDRRIVEMGCHDDLMKANGVYASLYSLQAKSYV